MMRLVVGVYTANRAATVVAMYTCYVVYVCYTVSTQQIELFSTRSVYDVSQVPGWLPKRELKRIVKLSNNAMELFTYLTYVHC